MLAWKDILSRHSENLSRYQSNDCSPSTWFSSFTSLEGMKDFNSATTTGTGVLLAYKGSRTLDCRVEEEEEEEEPEVTWTLGLGVARAATGCRMLSIDTSW